MVCQLTPAQEARMYEILRGIADDPHALEMQQFIQHGTVTTYEHCLRVTRIAYWLNLHWHCHADEVSLVRGAFLHDFYLYDWHNCSNITHWHGFKHPLIARYNADAVFQLNNKERNIIQTHMWPLTITQLPRCREAYLVCLADKMSSSWETLMDRRAKREATPPAAEYAPQTPPYKNGGVFLYNSTNISKNDKKHLQNDNTYAILQPYRKPGGDMTMKFWDDEKSITLTRCVVVAALIGSIAMTLGGPWVTAWFIAVAGLHPSAGLTATLLVLGYACAALAIGMLVSLYKFLRRIEKGEVFVPENVAALRRISWCCAGAAVLCLAAVFICYRPFAVLAAAAGFMALLVRVLKNAFAQAVRMKNELDYTI